MKILIAGGGGFIGGHLAKSLIENHELICVDIKPFEQWYQKFDKVENLVLDLKDPKSCDQVCNVDYIYNLACNMGGMGYIENNKAECMLSVLINTNLLNSAVNNKVKKFFFSSSACVYSSFTQKDYSNPFLKESDAYPADPEDGYGWEKLFSERMCRHYLEDYGLDVKVARYHNVYGPNGTYDGGREKAPAALCRKIIIAKEKNSDIIDVWGDGKQTRSFLFIEDCVNATLQFFNSNHHGPINIGSEEKVSINEMIEKIEKISSKKFKKNYQLDKPKGVRGRSSNNDLIRKLLKWEPKYNLYEGLKRTYQWIEEDMKKK